MSWNVLYWIIILFLSSNTVLKTFSLERSRTGIYYYTLLDPFKVIISKIIYNFLLLFLLGLVVYLLFIYFTFDAVQHRGVFLGDLALVSFGLSIVFSFSSAIANGESNSGVLISILGLPLVLPILLMGIKISTVALGITSDSQINMDFILLAAIDVLLAGIVIILFPILWKS
jgi:heme exporter protein B